MQAVDFEIEKFAEFEEDRSLNTHWVTTTWHVRVAGERVTARAVVCTTAHGADIQLYRHPEDERERADHPGTKGEPFARVSNVKYHAGHGVPPRLVIELIADVFGLVPALIAGANNLTWHVA